MSAKATQVASQGPTVTKISVHCGGTDERQHYQIFIRRADGSGCDMGTFEHRREAMRRAGQCARVEGYTAPICVED